MTTTESNTFGAVAESWSRDLDIAEHGWRV